MQYELVSWKIFGVRPLLQNRAWNLVRKDPGEVASKSASKTMTAFEEAEKQLYTSDDGKTFYHPGIAFWKALFVGMAGKQVGGMAVSTAVSVAVAHVEDEFLLLDPETLASKKPKPLTAKRWVVDERCVVNGNCKPPARILAARPKWTKWGGILTLEVDLEVFKAIGVLTELHNIAGRYGVGAGRIRKDATAWGGLGLGKYRAELI